LRSVTIGTNVNVSPNSFPGNLADVYTGGGRRAGTYTRNDTSWRRQ
jgi:hypothetical protein